MNFEVGLIGAFIGGLLSFASPCVLPLVPPYLCYLAGVSIDQFKAADTKPNTQILLTALFFVAGFSLVFVGFGASATLLGKFVQTYFNWLSIAAGIVIILMGLHFIGLFRIALLYREARLDVAQKPAGFLGAFVMGLAFAFGWTPCVGPVLAAILVTAGGQDNVAQGVALLTSYSLGLGMPFLAAAAFSGLFMSAMTRFRQYIPVVEKVTGVALVLTGILILTGGMNTIGFWLLEYFPSLGKIG